MTAIGGLMIDGSGNEFTARQRHVLYRETVGNGFILAQYSAGGDRWGQRAPSVLPSNMALAI
ncbi:hypothetical protein DMB90_06000 [Raoultella planticola]|uniref:Uncharacterized protein n=1 Tax=Raoultella planticola TaxID=575 RepID=A0A5P6A9D2_RAOPL|nr:hypothetical protein DMB90_06000 [Raoultella planticola]